jgi:hypothetical protein
VLHAGRVLSFGVSICVLSAVQAALVVLPRARELPALGRLRSGWWAAIPLACVVGFVFGVRALGGLVDGLTWLALVCVPPLAAVALGWMVRGARPWLAALAPLLFALAWADRGGLAGQSAAIVLEALSCVTLAVLLVAVTPPALVKLGIVAAAIADTWLVVSNLLTAPNGALNAATPPAHLPQLQSALFSKAVIGYEDLFVAALLGALLAPHPRLARRGAALALAIALAFDLLFLAVNELPATVPIAITVVVLEIRRASVARGTTLSIRGRPKRGGAP